jgi:hypothetical protein
MPAEPPASEDLNEASARLLLEASRERARGVRDTADAINAKVSWVLAYLGVLLLALVQDWSDVRVHRALQILATVALASLFANVIVAGWSMRMKSLTGPEGEGWCSEERCSLPPARVAFDLARTYLSSAEIDRRKDGALSVMTRRFSILKAITALTTFLVCAFFCAGVWIT